MDKESKSILHGVIASFGAVLLGGNAYFVKRLVDGLDSTNSIVIAVREDVAVMKATKEYCRCRGMDAEIFKDDPRMSSEKGEHNASRQNRKGI